MMYGIGNQMGIFVAGMYTGACTLVCGFCIYKYITKDNKKKKGA